MAGNAEMLKKAMFLYWPHIHISWSWFHDCKLFYSILFLLHHIQNYMIIFSGTGIKVE
jgi:hypothetical protein